MHIVIGGAYNGKANWVKSHYKLTERKDYVWHSAYKDSMLPRNLAQYNSSFVILEGIEHWVKGIVDEALPNAYEEAVKVIEAWLNWSNQSSNQLVLIGTDISKGIVPIDQKDRTWRDVTGYLYQRIAKDATTVHYIWYGIAKQLK